MRQLYLESISSTIISIVAILLSDSVAETARKGQQYRFYVMLLETCYVAEL